MTVLYLLIIGYLPGAAIFRMPWMERDARAALDAEERAFWAVIISLGVSLAAVLALAALGRYSFERLLAVDAIVTATAAVISRGQLLYKGAARRPGLSIAIPLALVLLGVWRFFPPSEYIMGGKDPGVYMNAGIQIGQRGTLWYDDPVVDQVPSFAWDLFFPYYGTDAYYSTRFMGFYVMEPESGEVVSQFPHLYPASIAIGYGLDGLTGARRVSGAWAILGVLAVYFAAVPLFGRGAAAFAAGLLALHVIQVWFARYPNAEMVMQAMGFAVLLATSRAQANGMRFFAPVAGGLLGLMLFLRVDAVFIVAAVTAGAAALILHGGRLQSSLFYWLAAIGSVAAVYLVGPMRGHMERPIIYLTHLPAAGYAALAAGAAVLIAALVAGSRAERLRPIVGRWVPIGVGLAMLAATVYALFFRHPGGRLAAHDAYALRTYANLYVTIPGVLAAAAGYALYARRVFWKAPAFFLAALFFALFFFYKIQIVPEHFWMARRFVPVILPMTFVFAAALAFGAGRGLGSRVIKWTAGLVFIGLLGMQYQRAARPILDHVEYAGMIPKLEELAGRIHDDDLVIAESRNAGSDIHVLATPLAYIYARNVLLLASAQPDKPTFARFLEHARARYARVLFLGSGGTNLLSHRYGVHPLHSGFFRVPEFEVTTEGLPRVATPKDFDYGLYEFTDASGSHDEPFDLDVGIRDDLHVIRFHAKEVTDDRTIRWTQDQSFVAVTSVPPDAREVRFWMHNGGRPAAAPPADMRVFFAGTELGTIRVEDGWREYALPIPPDIAARAAAAGDPVELRLVTTTWNPHDVVGLPDTRDLGVMLDRVAVR